ncbi:MAG: glutaminyl-peptide cyclotransferase [Bacteroidales bacterium]|nr:glutaminyl-peptide cyclotransferase [Bacteroidales bacterium]
MRSSRTDVLNGIAHHKATGDIYLTGKYWPRMYKVTLEQKK